MGRIPRIPTPSINNINPPTPRFPAPVTTQLQQPVVDIPFFEAPEYSPPIQQAPLPETGDPSQLTAPPPPPPQVPMLPQTVVDEVNEDTRELQEEAENYNQPLPEIPVIPTARPEIDMPFVGTVPLPYQREVMLAGTTAIGATAAALIGKSLVEQLLKIMKPLVKKIMLKIKEKSDKRFSDYELQLFFEFEKRVPEQKALTKKLAKEQKAEKAAQLEAELQRRQNKSKRKGK